MVDLVSDPVELKGKYKLISGPCPIYFVDDIVNLT